MDAANDENNAEEDDYNTRQEQVQHSEMPEQILADNADNAGDLEMSIDVTECQQQYKEMLELKQIT